jgi:hypothetical protein
MQASQSKNFIFHIIQIKDLNFLSFLKYYLPPQVKNFHLIINY